MSKSQTFGDHLEERFADGEEQIDYSGTYSCNTITLARTSPLLGRDAIFLSLMCPQCQGERAHVLATIELPDRTAASMLAGNLARIIDEVWPAQ